MAREEIVEKLRQRYGPRLTMPLTDCEAIVDAIARAGLTIIPAVPTEAEIERVGMLTAIPRARRCSDRRR